VLEAAHWSYGHRWICLLDVWHAHSDQEAAS